jgi:hypothetical protein
MATQEQLAKYRLVDNEVLFLDFKWPWAVEDGELGADKAVGKAARKDGKASKKK